MTVTREDLAAFADGELDPARAAEVAAAVAADPALADEVRAHRALRAQLAAHFAPIMEEPLPASLTAALQPSPDNVVSFGEARDRRRTRWLWVAGPGLAASLALAVFMPRGGADYADGVLAQALDRQLVARQRADAEPRILLSFRDEEGAYCRAFSGRRESGIACRDARGWSVVMRDGGSPASKGDYRMAGASSAAILERAQAMATGPALDAIEEEAAKERGWR